MPRYDLLAIDLDGTLLNPSGRISDANVRAIHRATRAGMRVSICTGRGYNECKAYAARIGHTEPVIVAGGAIISDGATGATLQRFSMRPALVRRLVETLTGHGHAALVLKDPAGLEDPGLRPGHDYLIVSPRGEEAVDPISMWWFKEHRINVRIVPSLDHDEHPEHTVRVGVCGTRARTQAAANELKTTFANDVVFHHFGAVVPGDDKKHSDDQIVILEAFDNRVNKWAAIRWLADGRGVPGSRIAAIGNDINDVAMLEGAGLGVAMGNAIPEAKTVAHRHTLGNDEDGVAHAIERMLAGEW